MKPNNKNTNSNKNNYKQKSKRVWTNVRVDKCTHVQSVSAADVSASDLSASVASQSKSDAMQNTPTQAE